MSKAKEENRVLILQGCQGPEQQGPSCSGQTAISFTLPEPKTGRPAAYVLINGVLQELNRFKQQYSSWLIGEELIADGSMYLGTPVDPLYVLLPVLEKNKEAGMFKPLDELLYEPDCPALTDLARATEAALACICETRKAGPDTYYRLSEERVLAWLSCKLRRVRAGLAAQVAGMDDASADAYAHGFMSEYMTAPWAERLAQHLNIATGEAAVAAAAAGALRASTNTSPPGGYQQGPPEKRQKLDPKAVAAAKAAEARAVKQAEVRAKQAEGTKKISAFFTKK